MWYNPMVQPKRPQNQHKCSLSASMTIDMSVLPCTVTFSYSDTEATHGEAQSGRHGTCFQESLSDMPLSYVSQFFMGELHLDPSPQVTGSLRIGFVSYSW